MYMCVSTVSENKFGALSSGDPGYDLPPDRRLSSARYTSVPAAQHCRESAADRRKRPVWSRQLRDGDERVGCQSPATRTPVSHRPDNVVL